MEPYAASDARRAKALHDLDAFILLAAGAFLAMLLLVILDITIGIKNTIKRLYNGIIMLDK